MRFLLSDSKETRFEHVQAVVYTLNTDRGFIALGYSGRRKKPDFYNRFLTMDRRDEHIRQWLTRLESVKTKRDARQDEKRAFRTTLEVGNILR